MFLKNQTCCFTGHRVIAKNMYDALEKRLEAELLRLIAEGVTDFQAGGALGFDTLAAQTVLKLKHNYPQIKLILVLPCRGQDEKWGDADKKVYSSIVNQSDNVIYTAEAYHSGCMHKRNRYLVDSSSVCVCYRTRPSGGTAYTVAYAEKSGLEIVYL